MPLNAIEILLHDSIGLHSSTVGSNTIRQAVNIRMRACHAQAMDDYLDIIKNSSTEMRALIEAVIVPETWFFRDLNPFVAFSIWVEEHKNEFSSSSPLNILSLPCSSGEEPYTLAMCLSDCGMDISHARIDAIDISQKNLDTAYKAEYGSNSFRGTNLLYRSRHFEPVGNRYRLNDAIRDRVYFECGNLLDKQFVSGRRHYHVIFCRNLLIYFDRPTQHLAIDRLRKILMPNGLIFVGHSETCLFGNLPFTPIGHSRCFGFKQGVNRTNATNEFAAPLPRKPRPVKTPSHKFKATLSSSFNGPGSYAQVVDQQSSPDNTNRLQKAFNLANEGHLDEAAQICEALLTQSEHQSDAHYLLGLVREAAGNSSEAEQLFRKAVYLDPDHFEALTHLSVLADRCGDKQRAQRFKDRAIRAQIASNSRLISQ